MNHLWALKYSASSLRRKRSDGDLTTQSSTTLSDHKLREQKSAPYRDPRYTTLLETKGSFMDESDLGINEKSQELVQELLEKEQEVPQESLFRDDIFKSTCRNVQDRNESRVIRDMSPLLVPSAENLTVYGAKELGCLIESVNEGWNNSIPITKTRPQPDYSVGFRRQAFTQEQLQKLQPFVGELNDRSLIMGTYYLYFPFLTCEVKCGAVALDVADRQILAFSISHDHESVRIYGHYAVMGDNETTYYRHPIRKFDFTEMNGKEKWTTYKFVKSVYYSWMPVHFARLCSVIDTLPADPDFGLTHSELRFSASTGLSQEAASHCITESDAATMPTSADDDSRPGPSRTDDTPDTSFTQSSGRSKRARRGQGRK